jgi:hypothetical protein
VVRRCMCGMREHRISDIHTDTNESDIQIVFACLVFLLHPILSVPSSPLSLEELIDPINPTCTATPHHFSLLFISIPAPRHPN